jgi:hypothetical protein
VLILTTEKSNGLIRIDPETTAKPKAHGSL